MAEAATWLDADKVALIMGEDLAGEWDETSMQNFCDGARSYVESRRPDLFVTVAAEDPDDPDVVTFTPGADVVTGTAMLAYRFYSRRTTPLGVLGFSEDGASGILREDPDVAKLLGIGRGRKFVFGGAPPVVEEAV
jgi:hypothetical protein